MVDRHASMFLQIFTSVHLLVSKNKMETVLISIKLHISLNMVEIKFTYHLAPNLFTKMLSHYLDFKQFFVKRFPGFPYLRVPAS